MCLLLPSHVGMNARRLDGQDTKHRNINKEKWLAWPISVGMEEACLASFYFDSLSTTPYRMTKRFDKKQD